METTKEFLKSMNIPSLKECDKRHQDVKDDILEMGQLKSNLDMEKFTMMKEGSFIAHQFHFVMRQYRFALYELKRMHYDRLQHERNIKRFEKMIEENTEFIEIIRDNNTTFVDLDIEIEKLKNNIFELEANMVNKACMVNYFEILRQDMIKRNGGKAPTNEQYQLEEPKYYEWFVNNKMINQVNARTTGINEGVWELIQHLEEQSPHNPNMKLDILKDTKIPIPGQLQKYLENNLNKLNKERGFNKRLLED